MVQPDPIDEHAERSRPAPDRRALAAIGDKVRARLAADPTVYRVPVERAEIFAVGDFLDAHECEHVMRLIDEVARPSDITRDAEPDFRTSYSGDVPQSDPVVRAVERRLYDLLGIDLAWGETVQGQRYTVGQQFKEHCDWFDTTQGYWRAEGQLGGQRSWTAMVYLNTVEAGGVTEFTRLGVTIPPQAGALLLWNNNRPDGRVNWDTLHAALPVERGVKYVITKWFRSRRWGA
ncbi:prolyl 4-hydroxylase [Novosphingobium chloroacetimidivorans]|uniref:Prolyl 4-hydroxylase n=1 Tax=Novosphingobium chloroacetimidivorans TaxID=1428314 RepID=A0A7W7KB73_9SPHN|nr:2OG-Fe(II) oxygenase [Novosphingobium chloroacetimidivorans]MBB4859044.1 prolyl 4-hydroxylase [Novosphingobium chloroacetimidivorans]